MDEIKAVALDALKAIAAEATEPQVRLAAAEALIRYVRDEERAAQDRFYMSQRPDARQLYGTAASNRE